MSVSVSIVSVWLQQTRIGLSLFDIQGLGYLKESVSNTSTQTCTFIDTMPVAFLEAAVYT